MKKVDSVVNEFLKKISNDRRFGRILFATIISPPERPQKIFLLDDLEEIGKAKLKDIAQRTGHSPQNLCMLYNNFEKEGLVHREVDRSNRRNTYYFLTDKGKKMVEEHKKSARKAMKDFFSLLSDDELEEFKNSLEKTNKLMEKVLKGIQA